MIIDVFTQSILTLSQEADCNFKVLSADNFLDLHDVARSNIALVGASDLLILTQHAHVNLTVAVSAENTLTLSQSANPRVLDVSAHSYLVLAHQAINEDQWPLVEQTLTLTQEATCTVSRGAYDTLNLVQEATYTIVKIVSAASALAMHSNATVYKPDKMWIADSTLTVNAP